MINKIIQSLIAASIEYGFRYMRGYIEELLHSHNYIRSLERIDKDIERAKQVIDREVPDNISKEEKDAMSEKDASDFFDAIHGRS